MHSDYTQSYYIRCEKLSFLYFFLTIITFILFFIFDFNVFLFFLFIIVLILFCSHSQKSDKIQSYIFKLHIEENFEKLSEFEESIIKEVVTLHPGSLKSYYKNGIAQLPNLNHFQKLDPSVFPSNVFDNFNFIVQKLQEEDFYISKEVNYTIKNKKLETLLIDDISKRFAIVDGFTLEIYPFTKLKNCEIYQSSQDIRSGGARTPHYRTEINTSVVINLKDNLQKPNITINFLDLHKALLPNLAYDIKGALDYILEQNNNIQS